MAKWPKFSILPDPPPISGCNIVTGKPSGVFGDQYGVFGPPKWFGHVTHGYPEIWQEVELVLKKNVKKHFLGYFWPIFGREVAGTSNFFCL